MKAQTDIESLASAFKSNRDEVVGQAVSTLYDDSGVFFSDEGPLHDYKVEYPDKHSSETFKGILRLICAFHNTYGGLILFGVGDKDRLSGKNRRRPNAEKINRILRENLNQPFEVSTNRIDTPSGKVDVLTVPPRTAMSPPVYVKRGTTFSNGEKVFLRKSAEVLEARGSDLVFLYGDRLQSLLGEDPEVGRIPACLPSSPATIQEFVGRFSVIEAVITWMATSRTQRCFLWGQGGSGKSTIAYEIAEIIAANGKLLKNRQGKPYERVIYISGKATYLDPNTGKVKTIEFNDFKDARDIFLSILALSDWETEKKKLDEYTVNEALDALEQLYEIENQLVVIDDIDTLTTSNVDAGMEELFSVVSRCKTGTKILYTQRGLPSFASNAAIEVPGMNTEELFEFVNLCCKKYGQEHPLEDDRKWIALQSEGRPLAVETIIGMRRHTDSYAQAFTRWNNNSSEARQYLFEREYEGLSKNGKSKHLLAALSQFDTPQPFDMLHSVLQFSDEQLQDAISETREMFLRITVGSQQNDRYEIGPATKLFVSEVSKNLDLFPVISARVKNIQSEFKSVSPSWIPIMHRAASCINNGKAIDAIRILENPNLPIQFREHAETRALLGKAYGNLKPPRISEARDHFQCAYDMGYRGHQMFFDWLDIERSNDSEVNQGIYICNLVVKDDGFSLKTIATFCGKLAQYQTRKFSVIASSSPSQASNLRKEIALNRIKAYSFFSDALGYEHHSTREKAAYSIKTALNGFVKFNEVDAFFDLLEAILDSNLHVGALCGELASCIIHLGSSTIASSPSVRARSHRLLGVLHKLLMEKGRSAAPSIKQIDAEIRKLVEKKQTNLHRNRL